MHYACTEVSSDVVWKREALSNEAHKASPLFCKSPKDWELPLEEQIRLDSELRRMWATWL